MKFRIKKYDKGFVVEVEKQKRTWYGKRVNYWVHYISFRGVEDEPFYFSSYDIAMTQLLRRIRWNTIEESLKT